MLNLHWPDGTRRRADYSSSRKDWSCWAGFHPPMKADALCTIPRRAPRLGGEQYIHRRDAEGAERRSAALTRPFGQGCTCRRKRAPRAMRQTRTGDWINPAPVGRGKGDRHASPAGASTRSGRAFSPHTRSRPTTNNGGWLLSDRHAQRSPHWGASVTALVLGGSTFISPPAPNAPQAAPAHTPAPGPAETSVPRGAANNRRAAASARRAAPAPAGAPCAA
jgi:hypothetical protein